MTPANDEISWRQIGDRRSRLRHGGGACQHALRALGELLEQRGLTVRNTQFIPWPYECAAREANVPYDRLYGIDAINNEFATTDVALVVGANDLVNPAAKHDPNSAIYGMHARSSCSNAVWPPASLRSTTNYSPEPIP